MNDVSKLTKWQRMVWLAWLSRSIRDYAHEPERMFSATYINPRYHPGKATMIQRRWPHIISDENFRALTQRWSRSAAQGKEQ